MILFLFLFFFSPFSYSQSHLKEDLEITTGAGWNLLYQKVSIQRYLRKEDVRHSNPYVMKRADPNHKRDRAQERTPFYFNFDYTGLYRAVDMTHTWGLGFGHYALAPYIDLEVGLRIELTPSQEYADGGAYFAFNSVVPHYQSEAEQTRDHYSGFSPLEIPTRHYGFQFRFDWVKHVKNATDKIRIPGREIDAMTAQEMSQGIFTGSFFMVPDEDDPWRAELQIKLYRYNLKTDSQIGFYRALQVLTPAVGGIDVYSASIKGFPTVEAQIGATKQLDQGFQGRAVAQFTSFAHSQATRIGIKPSLGKALSSKLFFTGLLDVQFGGDDLYFSALGSLAIHL